MGRLIEHTPHDESYTADRSLLGRLRCASHRHPLDHRYYLPTWGVVLTCACGKREGCDYGELRAQWEEWDIKVDPKLAQKFWGNERGVPEGDDA